MEPNTALLVAAEKVREAYEREGEPCGETLELTQDRIEVCNLSWNHPPPHSWEPAEFEKTLKVASTNAILRMLRDSARPEPWRVALCQAELSKRVEPGF